jgi:hypothetical protein
VALRQYRSDPWADVVPMARLLNSLRVQAPADMELVPIWLEALAHPFALTVNETARQSARLRLAYALGASHTSCKDVFDSFGPNPPWNEQMLLFRAKCYSAHGSPLRKRAARDLVEFRKHEPASLASLLDDSRQHVRPRGVPSIARALSGGR